MRAMLSGKRADEAAVLYHSGLGCNAIARKMGIDGATISRWAASVGLKFDRSQVALAVRAHTIDLAVSRLELAQKMAQVAHDLLDSLDGGYLVYSFGGRDNTYAEHELAVPPVEVVRNAMTVAGIAFDKASKVLELAPEGLVGAFSVLDSVATVFRSVAEDYESRVLADLESSAGGVTRGLVDELSDG